MLKENRESVRLHGDILVIAFLRHLLASSNTTFRHSRLFYDNRMKNFHHEVLLLIWKKTKGKNNGNVEYDFEEDTIFTH